MDELLESTVNAEAEAPVVEEQVVETPEGEGGAETQPETGEDAAPQRHGPQNKAENAAFAAARREAEREAREAQERAVQLEQQNKRLMESLGKFGYVADDPLALADQIEAQARQITVEQLHAERTQREAELQRALESSPEVQRLRAEKEALERQAARRAFSDDLAAIKARYKDETAKDVTELGVTFLRARAMGLDPLTAYDLVQKERERNRKPEPPQIGAVASSAGAEKEFYTSEELDHLTEKQLDDPSVLKRALKSLSHLGK